jgi:hypothetical protein
MAWIEASEPTDPWVECPPGLFEAWSDPRLALYDAAGAIQLILEPEDARIEWSVEYSPRDLVLHLAANQLDVNGRELASIALFDASSAGLTSLLGKSEDFDEGPVTLDGADDLFLTLTLTLPT